MSTGAQYPMLFGPVTIAGLRLANRVVMPPMATAMEIGSPQFCAWYEARAHGGVGLIVMEAISVDLLLRDDICERLQETVEAIHEHSVPVLVQLFQPSTAQDGGPFAPSETPEARAATEAELDAMPGRFSTAAGRCREVGFDGVEPHGAHGYFLNQMFDPGSNRREDKYGGDLQGRMRLGLDIVRAIRAACGKYPLFYRHTAQTEHYTLEDSIGFCRQLVAAGVDVLDISPSMDKSHADIAATVKAAVDVPVLAVNGMEDPRMAEDALQAGRCDLCAVGRQLIADADWPLKIREGRRDEIIVCTKCNIKCFGHLGQGIPIGCEQNPQSGNEYRMI